ncbi:MAG: hypothetical protein H0V66_13630 [Bdellovibrionales bacterium]|nr:hypothetical protein [Bdellovibrionales bacterium]
MVKMLLFFIFISQALAQSVTVKKVGSNIYLHGRDCNFLMKQADAINQWKNPQALPLSSENCICSPNCAIDVTKIVPKQVQEKQEVCAAHDGPNCWNSTLVTSGILSHFRYSEGAEMKFWMESPLCKERAATEPLQPGDIIAIRNAKGEEVHGFIHLTNELSFSKNGFAKESKYALQTPEYVFSGYGVPKLCRRFYKKPGNTSPECPNYANYFKCESMEDYLKKHPITNNEQLLTWQTLDSVECEVSELAFTKVLSEEQLALFKMSITAIASLALQKLALTTLTNDEKFIWKGISVKSWSLMEQIRLL